MAEGHDIPNARRHTARLVATVIAAVLAAYGALGFVMLRYDDGALLRKAPFVGDRLFRATSIEVTLTTSDDDAGREDFERAARVIDDRLDALDVEHATVARPASVAVYLPDDVDIAQLLPTLTERGELGLYEYERNVQGEQVYRSAYVALIDAKVRAAKGDAFVAYAFDEQHEIVGGPGANAAEVLAQAGETAQDDFGKPVVPAGWEVLWVPAGETLFHGPAEQLAGRELQVGTQGRYDVSAGAWVFIKGESALRSIDIDGARAMRADDAWCTVITFSPQGARLFREVTQQMAHDGTRLNVPQRFAITLGTRLVSIPQVDYHEYPDGIASYSVQISNLAHKREAANIAAVLNSGSLPIELASN